MKAYCIVYERLHDLKMFDEYRKQVMPTIEAYGGRFLVRGGELTVIEGEWPHPRLVVIEFPSRAAAVAWYHSPDYQKLLPLRLRSAAGNLVIVDGA